MRLHSASLRFIGFQVTDSAYACFVFMIILSCCVSTSRGCLEGERKILLRFKEAYNEHAPLLYPDDWIGQDCCQWSGVSCKNSTSHVVAIKMRGFYIEGLNPYLLMKTWRNGTDLIRMVCEFKFLEELDLRWSALEGMIPLCLGNLTSLRSVNLSHNRLQGSVLLTLGNLPLLQSLQISYNRFEFNLSTSLCNSRSLETLDLSSNLFKGAIPSCFSNFSRLKGLFLNNNAFEGRFAASLGSLQSLETLDLSSNLFREKISTISFKWNSLKQFDLSNNGFQGTLSASMFSNTTNLEYIDISNNELIGMVSLSMFVNLSNLHFLSLSNNQFEVETYSSKWKPSFNLSTLRLSNCNLNRHGINKFHSFLSTQNQLIELDVSYNSFTGKVPPSFWLNVSVSLFLQGNKFENPFYQHLQNVIPLSNLKQLDLSDNNMLGALPYNFDKWFPGLSYFNISSNYLSGSIPQFPLSIKILDLSNNNFSGYMPYSLTKDRTSLKYLDLSSNRLKGEILLAESSLEFLNYFKLSNNHFTGTIPPAIENCHSMILLDISHNDLSGDLSKSMPILPELKALLLGGNRLQGQVPVQLCHMNRLQFIDLSHNDLSGKVPSCLNNLSFVGNQPMGYLDLFIGEISYIWFERNPIQVSPKFTTKGRTEFYKGVPLRLMRGIDISSNQLSGNIPSEIGDIKDIISLNLSRNLLSGVIPVSFQNLRSLESLDVSYNHLTGGIPAKLGLLSFLTTFIVAYNNLSGEIPSGNPFSTFNESSFTGNPGLCGLPLMKNCSNNSPTGPTAPDPTIEQEEKTNIIENDFFFYSWIAFSYALGFAGVFIFLLLNQKCRHKFFKVVDMYSTKFC